jgi:transposase
VEVVERSDDTSGFAVLPKRWVVERSLGWFMQHRRLVRDFEQHETSATGWIYIAMLRLIPQDYSIFKKAQSACEK